MTFYLFWIWRAIIREFEYWSLKVSNWKVIPNDFDTWTEWINNQFNVRLKCDEPPGSGNVTCRGELRVIQSWTLWWSANPEKMRLKAVVTLCAVQKLFDQMYLTFLEISKNVSSQWYMTWWALMGGSSLCTALLLGVQVLTVASSYSSIESLWASDQYNPDHPPPWHLQSSIPATYSCSF